MTRKLIEVALPLDAINAASSKEKSIRHGHPSTLHLWWARRPLAACRAVLFAQLVDDPSAHPEEFPTEEAQDAERERLFGILEELVKWENSTSEQVLRAARAEVLKSTGGNPPPVLDPFAGGGSIPLEAQRLGLEAHASDLNPVSVLINKALIEIPPKWANRAPVHPDADRRMSWSGADGLAEDVRRYGQWIRDEVAAQIGYLYPNVKLGDGSEADAIAWIWARTATCPNPACGATLPLASSFWLGKKKGKEAWIQPIVDGKEVVFEIGRGAGGPPDPPKIGRGARFRCLVCGEVTRDDYVKAEGMAGRLGSELMAVVAAGHRQREYLQPTDAQVEAASVPRPDGPAGDMPENPRWFSPPLFGFREYSSLFTNRQLVTANTIVDVARSATDVVRSDAQSSGWGESEANSYAQDVLVFLLFGFSKVLDYGNAFCTWASHPKQEAVAHLFARQSIPMVWDYAEANPLAGAAGSLGASFEWVSKALERLSQAPGVLGNARLADARDVAGDFVITTDPPYYDNIGYADISDFFYVWLRRALLSVFPELFQTVLTPKAGELIATPHRHEGNVDAAEAYFEDGFRDVFQRFKETQSESFPLTFFYAFRQAESDDAEGLGSTGWATMLEGLLGAGWMVTATWPVRTELVTSLKKDKSALASSVVLACRPRGVGAGVTDRQGLLRALGERLPTALRELQKASIAPVDLRQAAIGPGMAVFSQFEKVVEPDGSAMRVRTALGLINQVLDQVLDEQQAEFDRETRWAIQWFSQFFEDEGPYGTAETLAISMDVSIGGLKESGIVASGGGKVRLLSRHELSHGWDPATDERVSVWDATQYLVKRLDEDGEVAAAELYGRLGGLADSAQTLATILYSKAEKDRPGLAGAYNALVASWPSIQRIARQSPQPSVPEQQTLDEI